VITLGSALSIRIIAAALAGTLLVACSPMADVGHESDPVCNPVRVRACGLPFPSDAFTVADPSSPTGRRVEVDDELVSELYRAQVPRSMWPSAVLDGASGFSSMAPVLFELDRPIDPATLPVEGGESFVVFDTADARRVAIRAEVDPEAAGSAIAASVVRAWPAQGFEHGHHYVAALTTDLRYPDGTVPERSRRFEAAMDGSGAAGEHHDDMVDFLAAQGLQPDAVLAMTDFTIRDAAEVREELLRPVGIATSSPHPVAIDSVVPLDRPADAVQVRGTVELTNFQDPGDGAFDGLDDGRPYRTTFELVVPAAAVEHPAPVAIYGHGYGGDKSRMIELLGDNDAAGVATIAVDWSYRGDRIPIDGSYVIGLNEPADQARFAAMVPQGIVDVAALRAAISGSLADLDVQPPGGDGIADLDTTRVLYEGTSYGGIIGTAALGAVPDLEGGILHVCGIGVMDLLLDVPVWPLQRGVLPLAAFGTDASVGVALLQHAVDPAEGANWAGTYRTAVAGGGPRPVLLQYGEGDSWVGNHASEALIQRAGLPPVVEPTAAHPSRFESGYGWQMLTNDGTVPAAAWGMYAHALSTTMPAARTVTSAWLEELQGSASP
jgi:hypothetical protein